MALWTVALLGLISLGHHIAGALIFTGDETRYAYASVAAWAGQGLALSPDDWSSWLTAQGVGANLDTSRGAHSIIHALLLSPVVAIAGLETGRWVQLLLVCVIAIPFLSASDSNHRMASAVWAGVYMVSVPVMAYLKLLYAECWIFLLLTVVLFYCSRDKITNRDALITFFCLVLLPFVHIRTALIAATFGVYLFYKIWRDRGKVDAMLILMALLVCGALPVFVWYQIFISGEVAGSASVAAMPSLDRFVKLVTMQLFGYRHGLAYYNPIALIGIAGLFLGALNKEKFLAFCAVAFSVYTASIVWGTASESYAGRFWVAAIPLLVYGTVYWFRTVDPRLRWIIVIPLGLLTLFNSLLFVAVPAAYLENRYGSVPYEYFQNLICDYVDFGLIAATDPFEAGNIVIHGDDDTAIAIFLIAFIACLVAMASMRLKRAVMFTTLASMIILFAVFKSAIIPIPPELYALERGVNENGNAFLKITTQDREMIRGFKVGKYTERPMWGLDEYSPREFVVTGHDPDGRPYPEQRISGYQLAKLHSRQRYSDITLTATKPHITKEWNLLPITLF